MTVKKYPQSHLLITGYPTQIIIDPDCKMADGSDGPQNTGYLINGILFHHFQQIPRISH